MVGALIGVVPTCRVMALTDYQLSEPEHQRHFMIVA